jgi:uncharacterized protein
MIFVDTVAWLHLFDAQKRGTEQLAARQFLTSNKEGLCTSDLVISETHKWLVDHGRPIERANSILGKLVRQELAVLVPIEESDRILAEKIVIKFADQQLSYTDAITVAIVTRCGIKKVFSFDRHFLLFSNIQRVPD